MKHSAIALLLGINALFAAPPENESIAAGPFRLTVPKRLASGIVVEKVASAPLYSAEAWAEKERNPLRQLKPCFSIRPQHWAIRLPKAAPKWYEPDLPSFGDDPTAPQILIHKADEWASIFDDGKVDATAAAKAITSMRSELTLWVKQPVERVGPAYTEGSPAFDCLKKEIKFEGGFGVRGVVQCNSEAELARRGKLHYLFLGLSADGSCQIIATFPLDLPGLPDDSPGATHLGYSTTKDYSKFTMDFDRYEAEVKNWLADNASKFSPKIEELDAIMASLVVKHWE